MTCEAFQTNVSYAPQNLETRCSLENMPLRLDVWQRELDLPVDTTWSDERRVKGLDLVGGHDDLDVPSGVETIELVQELQHSTLDFTFTTRC